MLTVHHLNNSRSQRILWLLEELQIPYRLRKYERGPNKRAPPELLAISPLGKSPVITDDNITLAESGAIIEYLITKHGNGSTVPPDSGFIDNLYFSHYAEGSLMPILIQRMIFDNMLDYIPKSTPFSVRPIVGKVFDQLKKYLVEPEMKKNIMMIEEHLQKSKSIFFAGGQEPTSADYQMVFPLEVIVRVSPDQAGPKIKEYVRTIHERKAYKTALLKGGKYAYAKL